MSGLAAFVLRGCTLAADAATVDVVDFVPGLAVRFAVVATIAATLGLLHCLLFAFESRDRRNLYFALLAGAFALVVVLDYREQIGAEIVLPVLGPLQRWAVSAVILTAVRFAHSLFRERAPRRFWVYLGLIVVLLLLSLVDSRFFDVPAAVLGLVVTLDALLSILHGWRRLEPEAWIVALGAGVFSFGGLGQMGLDLVAGTDLGDALAPYMWGGLALLLAGSIYLARTFARTRHQLESRLVELEAARNLQLAMLPAALPDVDGYQIAASMTTATEVGGDYYDAVVASDGTLWLAVGDAVGHGARAGTLVTVAKSLFTGIGSQPSAAAALEQFDEALRGMQLRRAHLALTLARLRGGSLEIASAGMPPAILRRADGDDGRDGRAETEEIAFSSLPLGSPLRQPYASRTVELAAGDLLLLLTDGLVELPRPDGTQFGYDAVRDMVRSADAGQGLDDWLTGLVSRYVGDEPPPDDVTLLAIRARR